MGNLYDKLELLCKEKGITRAKLCKDTGISPGNITDLKMGRKHSFSAKTMAKLASYFNVSIAYLLENDEKSCPAAYTPSVPTSNDTSYLDLIEDGYVGTAFPTSKGTLTITADDFDEIAALWNEFKARPEMKMLFKSSKGATKEQIEAVAQMLISLNKEKDYE